MWVGGTVLSRVQNSSEMCVMVTWGMWFTTEGTRPCLLFVAHYPSQLQPFSSLFKALSKTHVQKRSSGAFLASFAVCFLSYQNSCCSDYRTQQLLPPFWYIYYRQSHAGYYPTTEPYSTEMVLWLSAGSAVAMATQQGFFLSGKFFICAFRY